jgi:AraC-like DNA-binding protein
MSSLVILNYGFVALIVVSLIVFFEVLFNLKRPIALKSTFLLTVFSIAFGSAGTVYCNLYGHNIWLLGIPAIITGVGLLAFFSILYHYKVQKYVLVIGAGVLFLRVTTILLYSNLGEAHPLVNGLLKNQGVIRFVLGLLILLAIADLIFKITKKYTSDNIYYQQVRRWSLQLLAGMPLFLAGALLRTNKIDQNLLSQVILLVAQFYFLLMILFRPRFLNSVSIKFALGEFFTKNNEERLAKNDFVHVFFSKAYYLNKAASLEHLSKELNVSPLETGNFIYANYGLSYTDLVNKHRVSYFIDLLSTGKFGDYTIEALALQSGFSSRHHLYKSFKKFHGGTPSDYIKSIN